MTAVAEATSIRRGLRLGSLYVQVVIAIVLGVAVGALWPEFGAGLKPLGDAFIALVKMIIAPVIFLTVATGIAGMRGMGEAGRVAAKALVYFLTFSTLALLLGVAVGNIFQPGAGFGADPAMLDASAVASYTEKTADAGLTAFLLRIIPTTMLSALTEGSILQALLTAILVGISIALVGERAKPVLALFEQMSAVVFRVVAIVMRAAPIGAFGAMAFTVGEFGIASLVSLAGLVASFYLTALVFVLVILGAVCRANGFSIFKLLAYLKSELVLVLGTSSSEAALPALVAKLEIAGCDKGVVGIVVPTGYSFNLDGTNIYLTLAALFIAQACGIDLSFGEQAALLGVAMISSKGSAGVTGAGFVTLAATLSIVPTVPIAGMALILGIDRFMSECRSLTNFIGNAVATVVVASWEGALDRDALNAALAGRPIVKNSDDPDVADAAEALT